jgi:hypothetical protein
MQFSEIILRTFLYQFTIILIFNCSVLNASENSYKKEMVNRHSFGVAAQQAFPYYRLPEGKPYYSTGISAVYHQPFFKARRLVNTGIDIMPQFWFSKAHISGTELGINITFNLNIQIRKSAVLAFHIGSGAHYFGMETKRQADGFIFSDNFFMSFKHQISRKNNKMTALGFLFGWRHLSNLNVKEPNTGIDSILFGFYFDRLF